VRSQLMTIPPEFEVNRKSENEQGEVAHRANAHDNPGVKHVLRLVEKTAEAVPAYFEPFTHRLHHTSYHLTDERNEWLSSVVVSCFFSVPCLAC
jgi:hypothetical protein